MNQRLFCPAEDSSWNFELQTAREGVLVEAIASRLKLPYRVAGGKTFLGHAPESRALPKPAPEKSSVRAMMGPHDLHAVVANNRMSVYDSDGQKVWACDTRTEGVNGSPDVQGGDTPPGLYRCGKVTWTLPSESLAIQHAYGPVFIDLVELEDQERSRGRAGVGQHGGGTGLPDPLAPRQGWKPTLGCQRLQNEDARKWGGKVEAVQRLGGQVLVSIS